jgi:hypothetical protein
LSATAAFGQKQSLTETARKVRVPIRKQTFEPVAAAHNDLFVGYVGYAISKRKRLVRPDLAA